MVLVGPPFLPIVAQLEPLDSLDGAGDGDFGIMAAFCACVERPVLFGSFLGCGDSTAFGIPAKFFGASNATVGILLTGPPGKLSDRKSVGI